MQWRRNFDNGLQVKNAGLPHPSQRRMPLQRVWLKMSSARVQGGPKAKMKVSIFRVTQETLHHSRQFAFRPLASRYKPPTKILVGLQSIDNAVLIVVVRRGGWKEEGEDERCGRRMRRAEGTGGRILGGGRREARREKTCWASLEVHTTQRRTTHRQVSVRRLINALQVNA